MYIRCESEVYSLESDGYWVRSEHLGKLAVLRAMPHRVEKVKWSRTRRAHRRRQHYRIIPRVANDEKMEFRMGVFQAALP